MTTERITIRIPSEALAMLDDKLLPWQSRSDYVRETALRAIYGRAETAPEPEPEKPKPAPKIADPSPPTYEEYLAIREGIAGPDYWAEYESRYDSREAFLRALTKSPPFMDVLTDL